MWKVRGRWNYLDSHAPSASHLDFADRPRDLGEVEDVLPSSSRDLNRPSLYTRTRNAGGRFDGCAYGEHALVPPEPRP